MHIYIYIGISCYICVTYLQCYMVIFLLFGRWSSQAMRYSHEQTYGDTSHTVASPSQTVAWNHLSTRTAVQSFSRATITMKRLTRCRQEWYNHLLHFFLFLIWTSIFVPDFSRWGNPECRQAIEVGEVLWSTRCQQYRALAILRHMDRRRMGGSNEIRHGPGWVFEDARIARPFSTACQALSVRSHNV